MPTHHPNSAYGLIDKAIASDICPCGAFKGERRSFCYQCYKKLPEALKPRLSLKLSDSWYEAYEEAVEHLKEIGEIRR